MSEPSDDREDAAEWTDAIARAWLEEAERRWEEMESGDDPGIPGEEVFAAIRERFPR